MRRAVARGRVFPQSYSTDRRYARLSLKAGFLFPMMWANADDQGRLCGDSEEVKYAVCPNIDHITKADIPELMKELETNKLIKVYESTKSMAIQILDWWNVHKPQWAWPSEYSPPEGWQDHLRYKRGAREVVTQNWFSGETPNGSQVREQDGSPESKTKSHVRAKDVSGESLNSAQVSVQEKREGSEERKETEKETGRRKRKQKEEEEEGNSPESSGETSTLTSGFLLKRLNEVFPLAWGRKPNSRELAQLRDLEKELSAAGGATAEQIGDAFKEAAFQNKLHISYVRAVLLTWLGVERIRSP